METDGEPSRPSPSPPPPPQVLLDEVIYEILSWLPAKSLGQFMLVCKCWKSIISDPTFIKLHIKRSSRNPSLILTSSDMIGRYALSCTVSSLVQNPLSPIPRDVELELTYDVYVGVSCNGLVSLISHSFRNQCHVYSIRLWNPVTGLMSEKSPPLVVNEPGCQFEHAEFALQYDGLSDSYNVVAVLTDNNAKPTVLERTQVSVYSFGGGGGGRSNGRNWRRIQSFPIFPIALAEERKCVNGTFNWLGLREFNSAYEWYIDNSDNEDSVIGIDHLVIVSLDLSKETYGELALPRGFDEIPFFEPTVGVLNGCLSFSHDYQGTHFVVWLMKEFGDERSWTQLLNVTYYHHLLIDNTGELYKTIPLYLSENGDVLIVANQGYCRAIVCNLRDNRVEWTGNKDIKWELTQDYVPSLVLPP